VSYPILDNPLRSIALAVLLYAGASLITALVGRRRPGLWLIGLLASAIVLAILSGGET